MDARRQIRRDTDFDNDERARIAADPELARKGLRRIKYPTPEERRLLAGHEKEDRAFDDDERLRIAHDPQYRMEGLSRLKYPTPEESRALAAHLSELRRQEADAEARRKFSRPMKPPRASTRPDPDSRRLVAAVNACTRRLTTPRTYTFYINYPDGRVPMEVHEERDAPPANLWTKIG